MASRLVRSGGRLATSWLAKPVPRGVVGPCTDPAALKRQLAGIPAASGDPLSSARTMRQFRRPPRPLVVRAAQPASVAPLLASRNPSRRGRPRARSSSTCMASRMAPSIRRSRSVGVISPRSACSRKIAQMCSSSASTVSTVITISTSTTGISPRMHGPGRGLGPHCGPTLLPTKMSPSFASGLVMPVDQWHVNGTPSLALGHQPVDRHHRRHPRRDSRSRRLRAVERNAGPQRRAGLRSGCATANGMSLQRWALRPRSPSRSTLVLAGATAGP